MVKKSIKEEKITKKNSLKENIVSEEWKKIKLGNLFNISSSRRVLQSQWKSNGVPFYRGREITALSKNGEVDNKLFISKELYNEYASKYGIPKTSDIMITAIGTIGNSYVVKETDKFYFKDASVLWLNKKSDVDSEFINYWLKSREFFQQLDKGNGSTVDTLTVERLQNVLCTLPTSPEQKQIVEVLSDTYDLINNLERLLKKKKNIKQGVMQELLTGKRRLEGFSGEWSYKTFEELFDFLKTGSNSRDELSRSEDFGYIHYGDIHTKWDQFLDCDNEEIPSISKEKVKNLPFLQDWDLIVADASEDYVGIGACILLKNIKNKKIVSGLHTILLRSDKTKLSPYYSVYLMSIRDVKDKLIKIATGISVYGLTKNQLKKVEVYLPNDINEQLEIGKIFSDMDSEIKELETQKDKYIMTKQRMMQKLLTGEIRLK